MKNKLLILFYFIVIPLFADDFIKNGNFKLGKSNWTEDGHVVFLNDASEESNQEQEGYFPCLKVSLKRVDWSFVEQKIKTPEGVDTVTLHVEVMTNKDHKKSDQLNKLTDCSWPPGGSWIWGGSIPRTRNDITAMITHNNGSYRIKSVNFSQANWHVIDFNIDELGSKKMERTLTLSFPAGSGDVYIKHIWTE